MMVHIIGIIASAFTSVALLPQLIKMFREKKSHGISPLMLGSLLVGLSLWVVYGFMKDDLIIIIANIFALVVNICVLVADWFFRRKGRRESRAR
jgi:MtN3 and saliva related transmembrane protein